VYRFRLEHLRLVGWRLFTPVEYVNWCGHGQEFILIPERNGLRGAPGTLSRRAPPAAGAPYRGVDQPTQHPGALARLVECPAIRLAPEDTIA